MNSSDAPGAGAEGNASFGTILGAGEYVLDLLGAVILVVIVAHPTILKLDAHPPARGREPVTKRCGSSISRGAEQLRLPAPARSPATSTARAQQSRPLAAAHAYQPRNRELQLLAAGVTPIEPFAQLV